MTTQKTSRILIPALLLTLFAASHALAGKAQPRPTLAKNGNGEVKRNVARIQVVEGNVMVSQEAGLAAIEGTASLDNGTRVFTTAESRARIVYHDDCVVEMGSNQRVVIDSSEGCKARIAMLETILLEGSQSGTLVAGGAPGSGAAGGAAAAGEAGSLASGGIGGSAGGAGGSVASAGSAAGAGSAVGGAGAVGGAAAGSSGAVGLLGAVGGGLIGGPVGLIAGVAGAAGLRQAIVNRNENVGSPN